MAPKPRWTLRQRRLLRTFAPLVIVVPYIAYVIDNRVTDHNTRREELDYARQQSTPEKK